MSIRPQVILALSLAAGFWGCQSSTQADTSPVAIDLKVNFALPVSDSAVFPDSIRWKVGNGAWTSKSFLQPFPVTDSFKYLIDVHLAANERTIMAEWFTGGLLLRTSSYQAVGEPSASKTVVVDSAALSAFLLERHASFDPGMVPKARHHYGEFISAFVDTISPPTAEGSVWWGMDTSRLQKLTGPILIDRTADIVVQARQPGKFGPKIWYNYAIRPKISFAAPDPRNQYNEVSAIGNALRSAGVYGFGWSSRQSTVSEISKAVYVGSSSADLYLSIAYALQGDTANVGVGLQIGGAVDSLPGPEKGAWGIDLRRMVRLRSVFRFTPALNDSLELVLQIASMDPVYGVACAKGGCLRYAIKTSEINNGVVDIPLDSLKYPSWYQWGSAPIPSAADVLRRAVGVVYLVGGVMGTYPKPVPGVLAIQSLEFVSGSPVAADGLVRLP